MYRVLLYLVYLHTTKNTPMNAIIMAAGTSTRFAPLSYEKPKGLLEVKGENLILQAGRMKLTVKAKEVRLIEEYEKVQEKNEKKKAMVIIQIQRAAAASNELDIRGMMTDEAEGIVDRFIDSAQMGKLNFVSIIHGKGTGALRKSVHAQLKRHPGVKGFRLGRYGEGEDGVTIVELR